MVLTGTEVKAAKSGKVQLRDAYAMIDNNEAWLHNAHISEYSHGNRSNHAPVRVRKLLLHRREIDKLLSATREKGLVADSHAHVFEKRQDKMRNSARQGQEISR